jgi:hypothetical protein
LIERGIDLVQRGCGLHRRPGSWLMPKPQDQLASRIGVQAEAHDVAETAPRRLAARRLELDVTAAAREWLALSGFDPL